MIYLGLGGGFNERGTVEYKPFVESDDEFDEYGRKKKKKKQNSVQTQQPTPRVEEVRSKFNRIFLKKGINQY